MIRAYWEIIPGDLAAIPLESKLPGGQQAAFGPTDTLSATFLPPGQSASLFAPAVAWDTAGDTQTGWEQAQTLTTLTGAQTSALMPSVTYTLNVYRAIGGDPNQTQRIGSCRVFVRRPAPV